MMNAFAFLNPREETKRNSMSQRKGMPPVSEATGLAGIHDMVPKVNAYSQIAGITSCRSISNIRSCVPLIVFDSRLYGAIGMLSQ
jgi:hypothetical protein